MDFRRIEDRRTGDESTRLSATVLYTLLCGLINCQILNWPGSFAKKILILCGGQVAGKRQLSPISSSSDEGLTNTEPNPPRRKRSKHALPTSKCGCAEVCRDVVETLAQDRKFMGIGPGLTALKAAYRATGKSFEGFCFAHLRLLLSTATGMRNSYDGADFDSMRLHLTTYPRYRKNTPGLRKKKHNWSCTR